jgi:hypothetical protein
MSQGIPFKESMSTGFVIGHGEKTGEVQVFNFLKGQEETLNANEVTPLTQSHSLQMDNNEVWSEIRLLHFEEREQTRLEGPISTDPGSVVFFRDEQCTVVRSQGTMMLIENRHTGVQHWTTTDELVPGRRVHNNSWNYQNGKVAGDFAGTEASLVQGGYVWIAPQSHVLAKHSSIKRQLACIYELQGNSVRVFAAIDGRPVTVQDSDGSLRPVSDKLNNFLNQSKEFLMFKAAAVRGQDVERVAAGKHRDVTLLCLGISPLDQDTEAKPNWREKSRSWVEEKRKARYEDLVQRGQAAVVGQNQALVDKMDAADEMRELGGQMPQAQILDDLLSHHSYGVVTTVEPDKGGSGTMVMLGLAGAGALLFFLR